MERRGWFSPQVAGTFLAGGLLILAGLAVAAFVMLDSEADRITGEASVDAIISAVDRQDLRALLEQVGYQETPCALEPEPAPVTLLEPPKCPEGRAEGTPTEVFMTGNCEGRWVTSQGVLAAFAERLADPQQVYAVVKMDETFAFVVAQYRIVFGRAGEPEFPFSGQIAVFDGRIVQLSTWCDSALDQLLTLQAAGGETLFISDDLPIVASVQAAP